jgi:hypothetical protein
LILEPNGRRMVEWEAGLRKRYPTADVRKLIDMEEILLRETWEAARDIYQSAIRLHQDADRHELIEAILEARHRFQWEAREKKIEKKASRPSLRELPREGTQRAI